MVGSCFVCSEAHSFCHLTHTPHPSDLPSIATSFWPEAWTLVLLHAAGHVDCILQHLLNILSWLKPARCSRAQKQAQSDVCGTEPAIHFLHRCHGFFKDERETKKNTIVQSAKERVINGATFYPIFNFFLLNLQYCLTSGLCSVA